VSPVTLGSAVVVSIAVHVAAIAIALLAFGRHAPAAEEPAAIMVFVPPAPPAAAPAEEKPVEPPKAEPPPPPDFALPPPEESLAVPDFKPPPPPKVSTPPPKAAPPKPPVTAAPRTSPSAPQQQIVPPVNTAPSPAAAPSIVPGWNVALAAWLASHKRYPSGARQRGVEGEVLIEFTVEPDGHVIEVAVAKGSGHRELDEAAVTMLQGATVPPPGAAAKRTVRIHFRLDD
jgi:periplasmic protein TonB